MLCESFASSASACSLRLPRRQPHDHPRVHRPHRTRPARLQRQHELRRLSAHRPDPECAAPALARARRDAVHHPAPDQRAVDEAAADRVGFRHRRHPRRPPAARFQEAGARQPHHGAAGARLGRAGDDDAARIQRHPPVPGAVQRLSELSIPLHRIRAGQQERGDVETSRAQAREAGAGAVVLRSALALRRSPAPDGAARIVCPD